MPPAEIYRLDRAGAAARRLACPARRASRSRTGRARWRSAASPSTRAPAISSSARRTATASTVSPPTESPHAVRHRPQPPRGRLRAGASTRRGRLVAPRLREPGDPAPLRGCRRRRALDWLAARGLSRARSCCASIPGRGRARCRGASTWSPPVFPRGPGPRLGVEPLSSGSSSVAAAPAGHLALLSSVGEVLMLAPDGDAPASGPAAVRPLPPHAPGRGARRDASSSTAGSTSARAVPRLPERARDRCVARELGDPRGHRRGPPRATLRGRGRPTTA